MTVTREIITERRLFPLGALTAGTAGPDGWTIKDTSSAGTPTYVDITEDGGAFKITLAATSEAEYVTLYKDDKLTLDLKKIQRISFIAKVADIDANTVLVMGVGSAQANDEDTVATNAWFKIEGGTSTSNVVVETDDGTNDKNDIATNKTLAGTYKKFTIDFTDGLSSVKFYMDGDRVAEGTTFNMSDITSGQNVQPYFQLQKASGTGTPSVTLGTPIEIVYSTGYGA